MPRNGSGAYSLPEPAFVYDTVISETAVNSNFSDIASALSASLSKDGQTTPTANLPMGGYKLTGLANGSARTDSVALGQIQDGAVIWCGTAGGTANALTLSPTPSITAYTAGQVFRFLVGASPSTSTVTINVSSVGTKALQTATGEAMSSTIVLPASALAEILYDGTQFRLLSAVNISPFAYTVLSATNAAGLRTVAGLETVGQAEAEAGTATTERAWTAERVAQAIAALVPDAALPPGHLSGLGLSNAVGDTDHDIAIAAGKCRNSADSADVTLASALTKRGDATWAEGTGNGGAFGGASLPASGTCHWFLITKDADGTVDAGWDTDVAGANKPSGWTVGRRLGSLPTDGSNNFLPFTQHGDDFLSNNPPLAASAVDIDSTAVTVTLAGCPTGIVVNAHLNVAWSDGDENTLLYLSPLTATDEAPSATAAPLITTQRYSNDTSSAGKASVYTNTSAQIRARGTGTDSVLYLSLLGWTDTRGRHA